MNSESRAPARPTMSTMSNERKWILLNVGGTNFQVSRSVLYKKTPPSSPLHRISANSTNVHWDRDERGAYVIDRDPEYFQPIINFLRHGRLIINKNVATEGVLVEAEYYHIPELVAMLKKRQASERQVSQQPQYQAQPVPQVAVHHHQQQPQQQQMKQSTFNPLTWSPPFGQLPRPNPGQHINIFKDEQLAWFDGNK